MKGIMKLVLMVSWLDQNFSVEAGQKDDNLPCSWKVWVFSLDTRQ